MNTNSHSITVFASPAALRKTRGIPAAPLRAILDKSSDARGGMKGFKNHAFDIFPLRGFSGFASV
jgi:hypothetical protein